MWVNFKYEKMPNFCYWCGMVSHDAKECKVWLSSKGSLSLDQQEYGPWLRADPFSVGKKSFMFVPGTGGDFGGKDTTVRTGRETEERIQGAAAPQEAGTNRVDIAPSEGNQNSVSLGITATFTQTSHAGKILDCPESLPNVVPLNVHTDMVDFEAQIQEIDMELNKYDNNGTCTANPGFMAELSPSLSNYSVQEHARDKSSPVSHNDTHESSNEPCDSEGSQLGLRTWKRLARLKQTSEEHMHAPILRKRPIILEGDDETNQASKKLQISNEEHNLLAEAAEQSRQHQ